MYKKHSLIKTLIFAGQCATFFFIFGTAGSDNGLNIFDKLNLPLFLHRIVQSFAPRPGTFLLQKLCPGNRFQAVHIYHRIDIKNKIEFNCDKTIKSMIDMFILPNIASCVIGIFNQFPSSFSSNSSIPCCWHTLCFIWSHHQND